MKTAADSGELRHRHPRTISMETEGISLQRLINQLLARSMTVAFRSKSLVVNEVSRHVKLPKGRVMITPVLSDLLHTIVSNAHNGDINISADRFRDIITIQIQERNNYNGYALAYSVRALEAEAAMVGGSITIQGEQKKVVTISFSFPGNGDAYFYDC